MHMMMLEMTMMMIAATIMMVMMIPLGFSALHPSISAIALLKTLFGKNYFSKDNKGNTFQITW